MKIGPLDITFHRTVRVSEGRAPSNLPPSLGHMKVYNVKDYRTNCPASWEDDAVFVALHETEALWMSFNNSNPVAALVGAGGINAITGEKLGTKLEKDNYLVAPPQPWLDGWKAEDSTVYQFVGTEYKGGEGNTVGEQLIGAESKTGGIGIAVFEPIDRTKLKKEHAPSEMFGGGAYLNEVQVASFSGVPDNQGSGYVDKITFHDSLETMTPTNYYGSSPICASAASFSSKGLTRKGLTRSMMPEMGVGKGGKITQKIYPDPYGLEVWKDAPVAVGVIYLVNAQVAAEITGETVAAPSTHDAYNGKWFGLQDADKADVAGSEKFAGLKSAASAFPGNTDNVTEKIPIQTATTEKIIGDL